ncbi:MAG TPA: sigma-70 family RNA polymerase sigma factor [Acidimicrobiales bacterium]|nr:sigma-70 family RNA polymerase sigma factor [Acidimicrobiales bacterium]
MTERGRDTPPDGGNSFEEYLRGVAGAPALSLAEEAALAGAAASGDREAASRLLRSSLRLVVALARRYEATGASMVDLVQEGNRALLRAVESFEPERGFSFRSYATWLVRRHLAEVAAAPLEEALLARVQDAWDAVVAASGRQPTLEELAGETGLGADELADLLGRPPGDG